MSIIIKRFQVFASLALCLLVLVLLPEVCLAQIGTLDTSFGTDGKVITDFAGSGGANAMALQADGKIVVAGPTSIGDHVNFALARYKTDGTLDNTFGSAGKVITDFDGFMIALAFSMALQADGKIVVAGQARSADGEINDFALARYKANGTLDNTFGDGGKVTTDFYGFYNSALSVAIQADGKIVVAGWFFISGDNAHGDFALARYKANGTLDNTFGDGGKVITDFDNGSFEQAYSVTLQADGKIVVAGSSHDDSGNRDFALARYNPDGSLDASFDGDGPVEGNGKVTDDFYSVDDGAYSAAIQADGKIVVVGWTYDYDYDFALARYNDDGSLDTSFDDDGKVTTDFHGFGPQTPPNWNYDSAESIAIQADGKIVVAGAARISGTRFDFALARYNAADGSLDTSFDDDGKVTTDFHGFADWGGPVAIQADGKIVVAGAARIGVGAADFALARYIGVMLPQQAIADLIEAVQQLVTSGSLNHGQGNALLAKLQAAIQQLDRGNQGVAINQLDAFINQVHAFIAAGILTPEEGHPLIDAAQTIIDSMNASGRMAEAGSEAFLVTQDVALPEHYALQANYPNPFNPTTTLVFEVPEASHVKLVVYDPLGRQVRVLEQGAMQAGRHEATFEAAGLPSGLYVARLVTPQGTFTQKMLLLK